MMPAPVSQVSAPMHPMMANQQPPPAQLSQIELKYDNLNKVKNLIWSLKDSFAIVLKVAGTRVNQMAAGKTSEDNSSRFDKTLEDFFSICNQIELHLKAIQECTLQQKNSHQYLPIPVSLGKQDASSVGPSQDGGYLSYTQYLGTVKGQAHFARAVQEILSVGSRKIADV